MVYYEGDDDNDHGECEGYDSKCTYDRRKKDLNQTLKVISVDKAGTLSFLERLGRLKGRMRLMA